MVEEDLRTSEEWQKGRPVTVVDPDGWDRNNFQFSWFEERISLAEYIFREMRSTVVGKNKQ